MPDAPRPAVQALSAREAGQTVDDALYEGVPTHLVAPLQEWAYDFLTDDLARRVALRLRLDVHDRNELTELDGAELPTSWTSPCSWTWSWTTNNAPTTSAMRRGTTS